MWRDVPPTNELLPFPLWAGTWSICSCHEGSLLGHYPCVSVAGSIYECWCGRWDGMSLLHPEGVTGHFLLHLLDNEYCRARSSRSQHMPVASAAYFLVPVCFLLTFIEIFCSVLKLFFYLGWVLKSGTQMAAGAGSCLVVRTPCSKALV